MNNVWVESANNFMLREVSTQKPLLPKGIYKLMIDPFENPYLSRIQDKFQFPYKIYGTEVGFINRVVRSWKHTTSNLGVILNGLKGTGKTVTAELIANKLELPVIIISAHHPKLVSFLNDIQQDVVIFIDEFEKIYDGWENSLLSIMDGVMKTKHRLFFLLTTNELRVDRNLLQRPSRIRYIKTFSDLSLPVIMEVVQDKLIHQDLFDATITFISELPIITMDLIKSVVEEVNIHNEGPENFKDVFNIHSNNDQMYNVYTLENGKKVEVESFVLINPSGMSLTQGSSFCIGHRCMGTIHKVFSPNQFMVREIIMNNENEVENKDTIYFLERAKNVHQVFAPETSLTF